MRSILLLLATGCVLDSGLNKTDDGPSFDTADPVDSPPDTDTDTVPPDTAETGSPPPVCADETFAARTVPMDEACVGAAPVGTFTPVIEWTNTDPGGSYSSPVVGQLTDDDGDGVIDDDDTPDIVVAANSSQIWAISGDGTTLWSTGAIGGSGTAAIGDLDGDGFPEVVVAGAGTTTAVHGEDGSLYWRGDGATQATCGATAIADLDADGDPEVIIGSTILNGQTGALRGRGNRGIGSGYGGGSAVAIGATADIDGDGILEVVVGNALYDPDGDVVWYNGESDGFVAVANFDSDPEGEIVVTSTGSVRLQDDDGTVLWSDRYVGSTSGPPTVADFDGDGDADIGVAGMGMYMVIDGSGTTLWSRPTNDSSSGFTGSSVFDFEGDGAAEVVYADENDVFVFDGATGAIKLQETTHSSATCSEYPTIADVDNDGHAEIIYTSNPYSGSETGVRVIGDAADSWQPARKVWNQHAYNITNVDEDGGIPTVPDTNWDSYNNFRSGDITAATGGAAGTDLFPYIHHVCADECGEGRVTVWLSVGNEGLEDVEADFVVEVWGDTDAETVLLHSFTWTSGVAAGTQSASESFELDVPGVIYELTVAVDGGDDTSASAITECDETNNVARWAEVLCR